MSTTARFPTITPEGLAALRARIGRPVRRPEAYIEVATRDAIRHWAHGIGDRNPLWASAGTAPPTILFAMDRVVSGYVGDIFLNPINWLVAPIIEVDGVPSVIAHKNRMTTSIVQIGSRVGEIVNERSRNLEKFQGVEEASLDLYTAVRNAYLQKRAQAIRE